MVKCICSKREFHNMVRLVMYAELYGLKVIKCIYTPGTESALRGRAFKKHGK